MQRNERERCWEARDLYFQCLDRHDILDSIKDASIAEANCGKESENFQKNCATSWVRHLPAFAGP